MPWARIPPDKMVNLPVFGIDVVSDDGDFVWLRGPSGRMRVNKLFPRVWFETVDDAKQAGATAIRIASSTEQEQYDAAFAKDEPPPQD
jgi:hypothetical protein